MPYIETTHVGSLPRSPELADLLIARDHGRDIDDAAFEPLVSDEISRAVASQVENGITIVSDGELGKVGYATYSNLREP